MVAIVFTGADHFAMGAVGDVGYAVEHGVVVANAKLSKQLAQTRQGLQSQHPVGQTLLTLLGPRSVSAACPACFALIAAAGAATAACGACVSLRFRDCNALCGIAAGATLAAITCCNT